MKLIPNALTESLKLSFNEQPQRPTFRGEFEAESTRLESATPLVKPEKS